jgi:hypothetical protein
MSTLDAELNDFGAQLATLGGHAADRSLAAPVQRTRFSPESSPLASHAEGGLVAGGIDQVDQW